MIEKKKIEHININTEVIKYKKEIKSKINKLLDNYLNELMNSILKTKNENEKYKYNFYNFNKFNRKYKISRVKKNSK